MVINNNELKDLGLTESIMLGRFKKRKPVFIGDSKYIITDLTKNYTGIVTYRMIKLKIKE